MSNEWEACISEWSDRYAALRKVHGELIDRYLKLEAENAALQARVASLSKGLDADDELIQTLQARVQELEQIQAIDRKNNDEFRRRLTACESSLKEYETALRGLPVVDGPVTVGEHLGTYYLSHPPTHTRVETRKDILDALAALLTLARTLKG